MVINSTYDFKTIKQLYKQKDSIRFDHAIQRSQNVWKQDKKSLFIHSLCYGFPYPPIYSIKEKQQLWILDGKQRMTSVFEYIEDQFVLSRVPKINKFELTSRKFSQLPEEYQDSILDSTFQIYQYENLTNSEVNELFLRLNGGVPLTRFEKTRAIASRSTLVLVRQLKDMPFFKEKVNIGKNARTRYIDEEVIFQTLLLLFNDKEATDLSSKQVRKAVRSIETIPSHLIESMFATAEYLNEAVPESNKSLKKVHIPSLFLTAMIALEQEIPASMFGTWINKFFKISISNPLYSFAATSGSTSKSQVQQRILFMKQDFETFLKSQKSLV